MKNLKLEAKSLTAAERVCRYFFGSEILMLQIRYKIPIHLTNYIDALERLAPRLRADYLGRRAIIGYQLFQNPHVRALGLRTSYEGRGIGGKDSIDRLRLSFFEGDGPYAELVNLPRKAQIQRIGFWLELAYCADYRFAQEINEIMTNSTVVLAGPTGSSVIDSPNSGRNAPRPPASSPSDAPAPQNGELSEGAQAFIASIMSMS